MSIVQAPVAQRLILDNVDWRMYSQLLRAFAERPGVRMTYDRGTLEIMSPLLEHDGDADFIARLIVFLADELNLPVKGSGSTTLRRRKKQKGLEPDRGYWIANEAVMRTKRHYDPKTDPPPDLAIEVDVTNSSLDRMSIYASLGVPEVWRLDGASLTFHILGNRGKYARRTKSMAFPGLTPADLMQFMALRGTLDETTVARQFRTWVQQRIGAGWK
jgi:Uma2 family endonuclease